MTDDSEHEEERFVFLAVLAQEAKMISDVEQRPAVSNAYVFPLPRSRCKVPPNALPPAVIM